MILNGFGARTCEALAEDCWWVVRRCGLMRGKGQGAMTFRASLDIQNIRATTNTQKQYHQCSENCQICAHIISTDRSSEERYHTTVPSRDVSELLTTSTTCLKTKPKTRRISRFGLRNPRSLELLFGSSFALTQVSNDESEISGSLTLILDATFCTAARPVVVRV